MTLKRLSFKVVGNGNTAEPIFDAYQDGLGKWWFVSYVGGITRTEVREEDLEGLCLDNIERYFENKPLPVTSSQKRLPMGALGPGYHTI